MRNESLKIFIGPAEVANIAAILGDAFRQRGIKVTVVSIGMGPFQDGMKYDRVLAPDVQQLNIVHRVLKYGCCQLYCFVKYALVHDVFIFLFGNTLLPLNLDLPILKLLHKKTVMRFLGDDIRYFAALGVAAKKTGLRHYMSDER